ncbi:hypothetical protein ATCC90586_001512 [Pythium insidiosum]|nr:hypothetical protein ATCC90586_001512 [Pythium insidiosum]
MTVAFLAMPSAPVPLSSPSSSSSPALLATRLGSEDAATPAYKVPKFLRSLYSILRNEDASVVNWVQNQELKPNRVTAFHILDLDRFEQEILPKYFKHSKFASFQRQLNNFGFRKWTKTQSSGVCTFSHNSFPPDPKQIGVLRASIREQWRPKGATETKRRVGNGITKAERKLQEQVQQRMQMLREQRKQPTEVRSQSQRRSSVEISRPESFSELLKTPLTTSSGLEAFKCPTHQPATKQLARPMTSDWGLTSGGFQAFSSPVKAALPPLQQSPQFAHVSYDNTVDITTYHQHENTSPQPEPLPLKLEPAPITGQIMAMHPTVAIPPWNWEQSALQPSFEPHPYHVAWQSSMPGQVSVSVSPSTIEEFTFDNLLLFAE